MQALHNQDVPAFHLLDQIVKSLIKSIHLWFFSILIVCDVICCVITNEFAYMQESPVFSFHSEKYLTKVKLIEKKLVVD